MYANVKNLWERDRLHADTCRQGGGGQNREKSCGRLLWMAIGPLSERYKPRINMPLVKVQLIIHKILK